MSAVYTLCGRKLTTIRITAAIAYDLCLARAFALDRRERYADAVEFAFEIEHGSLRAVPQPVARTSLYDRNPVRFWQIVSALLLVALLVALAR